MNPADCSAGITMEGIKRTFSYNNTPVLTLSIHYPKVALRRFPEAEDRINAQIQAQVRDFFDYASGELYQQAIATYQQTQKNGFPFHPYEAILQYEITYNQHCCLSLYSDQYTYTGGAHGSTIRTSDTFSLMSGRSIPLQDFFPEDQDYRVSLIAQMIEQASENPEVFFEDYPDLIEKYFNEEHYYLTPSGLAIYYLQYEIAPYSTGIVVFTIPYME